MFYLNQIALRTVVVTFLFGVFKISSEKTDLLSNVEIPIYQKEKKNR